MKLINIYSVITLLSVLVFTSCSKFNDINTNPETPEKVNSAMIATRIILAMSNQPGQKSFMQPYLLTKQIAWSELAEGYQYNGFGTMDMSLTFLNDAHFMEEFAVNEEQKNAYKGLSHFARAFKVFELTMALGDIPYADALMGESNKLYFPKYDSQKDVFMGVLKELDQADVLFSKGAKFEGDPVFGGDPNKWRKLVNSFALNVLVQLSGKTTDADLKVIPRFAEILNNKPVFGANEDSFQLIRSDNSGQTYPFYKVSNSFVIYPMVSSEIIDRLKTNHDRRLFYFAKPSPVKIESGLKASDFNAYQGVDPSLAFSNLAAIKKSNDYSQLNFRYTELPAGEPTQIYGYSHFCFVVAEAAARGWVNQPAVDWYKKGIKASMEFMANHTPNEDRFHNGMPLDAAYVEDAIMKYQTNFPANLEGKIEAIITQKYLASFLQTKTAPYFDYRRTGYPKWKINPASSMNTDALDKMPLRWRYPSLEYNYNSKNVNEAVQRQFDGQDDVNKKMWLLK